MFSSGETYCFSEQEFCHLLQWRPNFNIDAFFVFESVMMNWSKAVNTPFL